MDSYSILSLYFSSDNLGIAYFNQSTCSIQSSQINTLIYRSHQEILHIAKTRNISLIITNNDANRYLESVAETIKIIKVPEKGLKDDIIESNLRMLRINPINKSIQNKDNYIKQLMQQSERMGVEKEKIRALGLLIDYLFNQGHFKIREKLFLDEIQFFSDSIMNSVIITEQEFQSLEIIKEEIHPSFIKGKGRSKEGFSILNLYESMFISQSAKKILKHIFRNPTYRQDVIRYRHQIIEWMIENCSDKQTHLKIFKSIHSIMNTLKKFQDSRVEYEDWRKIVNTLEAMVILSRILSEKIHFNRDKVPSLIEKYLNDINWSLISSVLTKIMATLDLKMGNIKRGYNYKLDELRKTYDNLPQLLTIYAQEQNWPNQLRIVFITQVGYLVRVPHEIQLEFKPEEEWNLQFTNSSGRYYSNSLTELLDQQYGDIYGEITDREKKIFFDLESVVCEIGETIDQAYWITAEIQCFWGLSLASKGMCKPRTSSEGLIISGGWHLLLAQDAIDNNAFSFNHDIGPIHKVYNSEENIVNTNYSNRTLVISGPNASGKSVFMKQTAIIIYLAHLGVFVPAEFAEIPLIDRMVIVESTQSVFQEINGFESQIMSLSRITTPGIITNKSLVLIDEMGSSINVEVAMKQLATTVKFLADNDSHAIKKNMSLAQYEDIFNIPLSLIVTHLTSIISTNVIRQNYYIRFLAMTMEKDRVCLYKIRPGLVKKGYGIDCAKSILDAQIIDQALKYWAQIKGSF